MNPLILLLLSEAIAAQKVIYQPQDSNVTTGIICVSNTVLGDGTDISWYRKSWRTGEAPLRVTSCAKDNNIHKYTCDNSHSMAKLEIYNIKPDDSRIYFCILRWRDRSQRIGNGITLLAGDSSTPSSSVHLLAPAQPPLPNTTVQLACVVRGARQTVHVTWNISGTHHRGRIISMEEPGGTWTFLSLISLPRDTWGHGEPVTCDVWFSSSPVSVHWEIPERGEPRPEVTPTCGSYEIFALTVISLLLLTLSGHLVWTFQRPDNKTQASKYKDSMTEEGIVYAQLDNHHLTGAKKVAT